MILPYKCSRLVAAVAAEEITAAVVVAAVLCSRQLVLRPVIIR